MGCSRPRSPLEHQFATRGLRFAREVWIAYRPFVIEKTVAVLQFATIVMAGLTIELLGKLL